MPLCVLHITLPRSLIGSRRSWNGNEPSMISTAWERHAGGDIAVHQWKGLGKGGLNRLEDWVEVSGANGAEGVGDDGRA